MTCAVLDYLAQHKATVIFVAGTVGSAAVATMPEPAPASRWYRWLFDFLHQFINSRRVTPGPKAP